MVTWYSGGVTRQRSAICHFLLGMYRRSGPGYLWLGLNSWKPTMSVGLGTGPSPTCPQASVGCHKAEVHFRNFPEKPNRLKLLLYAHIFWGASCRHLRKLSHRRPRVVIRSLVTEVVSISSVHYGYIYPAYFNNSIFTEPIFFDDICEAINGLSIHRRLSILISLCNKSFLSYFPAFDAFCQYFLHVSIFSKFCRVLFFMVIRFDFADVWIF